jgi:hypothetical protein
MGATIGVVYSHDVAFKRGIVVGREDQQAYGGPVSNFNPVESILKKF